MKNTNIIWFILFILGILFYFYFGTEYGVSVKSQEANFVEMLISISFATFALIKFVLIQDKLEQVSAQI